MDEKLALLKELMKSSSNLEEFACKEKANAAGLSYRNGKVYLQFPFCPCPMLAEVDRLLDQVGLLEVRDRKANKLSGGMKRRLGIAQALIGNPRIIVVDEPTTGLDPDERIRFRNILSRLSQNDVTIILSTHIVGDISSTCQGMALLNKGELVFNGRPEDLVKHAQGHVFKMMLTPFEYDKVKERYNVISTIPVDAGWEVQVVADDKPEYDSTSIIPNIEHAYVYFMEHKLHADLID
jgi:ABC-type multidrug transport system ATPase subunit